MEERSPGSYRLNIRGSSLRSPFGVRDIKIYWNEIPLTDPGGNTYLNQLGFYNFQSVEIIKGTAGSLYGAGIGGAVLINSMPAVWQKGFSADYLHGSYGANSFNANIRLGDNDHRTSIAYTHQNSDGYRVQTQMRRDIASWETLLKANERQTIHAYILYGDLYYQTPGALTLAEYNNDPRAARPPVGNQPGAVQAKAAIYQKNFIAGFSQDYHFSSHWQNTTAVYGAYTDFSNPGIRVYELRQEPHFGGRSVFHYKARLGEDELQLHGGMEAQKGFFETRDYANKLGTPDTLQTDDHTNNWQYMVFGQADLRLRGGWTLTAGASFNKSSYQITRLSVRPPVPHGITFENKIAPRIALLKQVFPEISLYASAASGFSTPTVSEVEKSTGSSALLYSPRMASIMRSARVAAFCMTGCFSTSMPFSSRSGMRSCNGSIAAASCIRLMQEEPTSMGSRVFCPTNSPTTGNGSSATAVFGSAIPGTIFITGISSRIRSFIPATVFPASRLRLWLRVWIW